MSRGMGLKVEVVNLNLIVFIEKTHSAAIHKLNWSPTNESILISGGQDFAINLYVFTL